MSDKIQSTARANVAFAINFELTIAEAKALEAIAGYGADAFLEVFYPKLGKHYLQANEADFRALLVKIQSSLPNEIAKIDKATVAINEALKGFKK